MPSVKKALEGGVKTVVTKAQEVVYHTQTKLLENLLMALFLLTGTIITMVSIGFLLIDYVHWRRGQAFLLVGIVVLLLGFMMRMIFNRGKYIYRGE